MKTKDVLELFDSSVRKLKKIYGTEAMNVKVATPKQVPRPKDNPMALCQPIVSFEAVQIINHLVIYPEHYLYWCNEYELPDEIIKFSVMNTACHEMAHHLHMTREVKRIRNEYVHDKKVGKMALQLFFQDTEFHGEVWKSIMEELGAKYEPLYWEPCYEMPKIFVR